MGGVLEGVRVLDFGRYIAGPFTATMLADMGAEVIRVERLEGSEDRFILPVNKNGSPVGGGFLQIARNKKGITLDPMKPEAREVVKRLVETADVVVANLPLPTLKAMGIDYDSLKAIKPDIILTMVSAFGADGPYRERVGFDLLGQAMSGAMHLSGEPDTPTRTQVPFVDFGTALFAAFGTMAALMERQKTGKGQMVEASLFSTSLAFNNAMLIEQALLAPNRPGRGNRGFHSAPNDVYQTKDGWIVLMVVGNPIYKRWARLMGEPEWEQGEQYQTDQLRGDNCEAISARMSEWCRHRTTEQALAELEKARVPAGPVYTPQQALDDPHVEARQLFKKIEYPGLSKPVPVSDTPVRLSVSDAGVRHRAPVLGEHTEAIMSELGFKPDEIDQLRKAGII
jgi:crotonobetainyl-CoA:carnitine CoA-transferase CaiB-like acyl-CoA transferase